MPYPSTSMHAGFEDPYIDYRDDHESDLETEEDSDFSDDDSVATDATEEDWPPEDPFPKQQGDHDQRHANDPYESFPGSEYYPQQRDEEAAHPSQAHNPYHSWGGGGYSDFPGSRFDDHSSRFRQVPPTQRPPVNSWQSAPPGYGNAIQQSTGYSNEYGGPRERSQWADYGFPPAPSSYAPQAAPSQRPEHQYTQPSQTEWTPRPQPQQQAFPSYPGPPQFTRPVSDNGSQGRVLFQPTTSYNQRPQNDVETSWGGHMGSQPQRCPPSYSGSAQDAATISHLLWERQLLEKRHEYDKEQFALMEDEVSKLQTELAAERSKSLFRRLLCW